MWRHTRTYRGVRRMSQEAITLATDRKSTRLNSSHSQISYAVFCLKKKKSLSYHKPPLDSEHLAGNQFATRSRRPHVRPDAVDTIDITMGHIDTTQHGIIEAHLSPV